jgi:hypothetical protein
MLKTSAPGEVTEGCMCRVFLSEHYLHAQMIPGVRMYIEENGRFPRYEFYGSIHKEPAFNKVSAVSGGVL